MSTNPKKLEAIKQLPVLMIVKQLRGFLGLTEDLYRIMGKLLNLKQWTAKTNKAFVELKIAMITALVLALPDFSQEFIIETNASGNGIGAVLMQQGHLVAFINKALSSKHQALSAYDNEMFAILFVVKKWHFYLVGRYFTIRTDHQPIKYLLE